MPDSGLFIGEYFSPFAKMQTIKATAENLFSLIQDEYVGYPFP